MKTFAVYGAVLAASCGLFFILGDLEAGLPAALVILTASFGCSYVLVEVAEKMGWFGRDEVLEKAA